MKWLCQSIQLSETERERYTIKIIGLKTESLASKERE